MSIGETDTAGGGRSRWTAAARAYADELLEGTAAVRAAAAGLDAAARDGRVDDRDAVLDAVRITVAQRIDSPVPAAARRGLPGRSSATAVCPLVPRLLAARAAGRLSVADSGRLARHIEACQECAALERRAVAAERAFEAQAAEVEPPPARPPADADVRVADLRRQHPTPSPITARGPQEAAAAPRVPGDGAENGARVTPVQPGVRPVADRPSGAVRGEQAGPSLADERTARPATTEDPADGAATAPAAATGVARAPARGGSISPAPRPAPGAAVSTGRRSAARLRPGVARAAWLRGPRSMSRAAAVASFFVLGVGAAAAGVGVFSLASSGEKASVDSGGPSVTSNAPSVTPSRQRPVQERPAAPRPARKSPRRRTARRVPARPAPAVRRVQEPPAPAAPVLVTQPTPVTPPAPAPKPAPAPPESRPAPAPAPEGPKPSKPSSEPGRLPPS